MVRGRSPGFAGNGTNYSCLGGCNYDLCTRCFERHVRDTAWWSSPYTALTQTTGPMDLFSCAVLGRCQGPVTVELLGRSGLGRSVLPFRPIIASLDFLAMLMLLCSRTGLCGTGEDRA